MYIKRSSTSGTPEQASDIDAYFEDYLPRLITGAYKAGRLVCRGCVEFLSAEEAHRMAL